MNKNDKITIIFIYLLFYHHLEKIINNNNNKTYHWKSIYRERIFNFMLYLDLIPR